MRLIAIGVLIAAIGCHESSPDPDEPARPPNPTCLAPPRPIQLVRLERAFPQLEWDEPVQLEHAGDSWYVIERRGMVWRFADDPEVETAELVLDLSAQVDSSGAGGLLSFALHPRHAENGEVFLSYTQYGGTRMVSRVSRFRSLDGGETLELGTEEVLVELDMVSDFHVNTDLAFGPDGMLYVGFGDGGPHHDPDGDAQNPFSLRGKILRLDVDQGAPYAIPADNPFAAGGGAPEVWALGLRNPWRFGFDRETGELWAGDVGDNRYEEIDRIERGANYGWPVREGAHCLVEGCDPTGLVEPLYEHAHPEAASITMGFVYRGGAIPELYGQLIYGDYVGGFVFAVTPGSEAPPRVISSDGQEIVAFAEDRAGELYVVDLRGALWKLERDPRFTGTATEVPARLSETGCFDDEGQPLDALIPYDVAVSFWSDGAAKQRWLAIPDGTSIHVTEDRRLELPIGSVLVKDFTPGGRRVETRLLVRHDDGEWAGYTYVWNEAERDGVLVPFGSPPVIHWLGEQFWYYPRRDQCLRCHTQAAGRTLGLELAQLDVERWSGLGQLAHFEQLELFDADVTPTQVPALPRLADERVPVADRARAWLHVNCSFCHRPGALRGAVQMDLRSTTPLSETGVCDVEPVNDLGIADARRVAPGEPERSVLMHRIRSEGLDKMPPLASFKADPEGVALVEAWIAGLSSCAE